MLIVFAEQARVDAKLVSEVAALPGLLRETQALGARARVTFSWRFSSWCGRTSVRLDRPPGSGRSAPCACNAVCGARDGGWRRAGTGASRSRASFDLIGEDGKCAARPRSSRSAAGPRARAPHLCGG
jgi:hypothetical protein